MYKEYFAIPAILTESLAEEGVEEDTEDGCRRITNSHASVVSQIAGRPLSGSSRIFAVAMYRH